MKIIEIIKILEPYLTEFQKKWPFWAEHDVLGFNVDYEIISKEDLQSLNELGVFYSDEDESLMMFV